MRQPRLVFAKLKHVVSVRHPVIRHNSSLHDSNEISSNLRLQSMALRAEGIGIRWENSVSDSKVKPGVLSPRLRSLEQSLGQNRLRWLGHVL